MIAKTPTATPAEIASSPETKLNPAPNNETPWFEQPKEPSIGERVFGAVTYTGIGYLANLAVSVALWDFLMDGPGRGVYAGTARGAAALLRSTGMSAKTAQRWGSTATKMSFSPLGGHLTMIPVGLAEKHARYITHEANKLLDKNYKYKDLKFSWSEPEDNLPPMVEEPTDQTWGQIAVRRGIAWATVTAAGTGLSAIGLEKPLEEGTLKAFNKGISTTGSKSLQRFMRKPIVGRYVRLTALDSYFTVITSLVVYMTNNLFGAKHSAHVKELDEKETDEKKEKSSSYAPTTPVVKADSPPARTLITPAQEPSLQAPTSHMNHIDSLAAADRAELAPSLPA